MSIKNIGAPIAPIPNPTGENASKVQIAEAIAIITNSQVFIISLRSRLN
jgi:hypothetical protein